ncbi:hypothetical protein MVEN_01310700 [Mycena venus]|uniref:Uncharacterized protein n=1 Tax=Mycena venus TaxID=2733690 RepID=A0A8H6XXJ2_9AGAR|nr:hypothetical protein MVEN_01310700 [Mycena venus]
MNIFPVRPRFLMRKSRSVPSPKTSEESPQEEKTPLVNSEKLRTASNVLDFALRTLSTVSSNIPLGSVISSVIDPLLLITGRIQQTSANAEGLTQLAARIELLTPVVSAMTEKDPNEGKSIVEAFKRELQSITKDLEVAGSRGKLNQFFNSVDDASSLQKHNMTLSQMIADSTLATVQKVSKSVQELERLRLQESSSYEAQIVLGDITGGYGGPGGKALMGGEGGDGEGPKLAMDADERFKIGNISGGTGGAGGGGKRSRREGWNWQRAGDQQAAAEQNRPDSRATVRRESNRVIVDFPYLSMLLSGLFSI